MGVTHEERSVTQAEHRHGEAQAVLSGLWVMEDEDGGDIGLWEGFNGSLGSSPEVRRRPW